MTVQYVRIAKFAADTGYTEKAVRRKIEDGVWLEGVHYRRAPDGTIHINVEAYNKWVEGSLTGASAPQVTELKSASLGKAGSYARRST